MKKSHFFFLLTLNVLLTVHTARSQKKYVFERPEMGSPFTISIYSSAGNGSATYRSTTAEDGAADVAADSAAIASAAAAAFRKADTLNTLLSDYRDSSEINRLSATSGQGRFIPVSAPLFSIIQHAQSAALSSQGSYDITIGPVVQLWRKARKTKVFPDADSLKIALARTGYRYLHLDTLTRSVWLEKPGMKLDVGGLGKGFVAQAVLDLLRESGYPCAMVNAGGKIVVGESPPGKAGWVIGINAPGEKEKIMPMFLSLANFSVATSGDIYQYVEFDGKRYSHIVDPKTGIGLTRRRNVTALAADGTTADWLATACSILPLRKSFRMIRRFPGAALFVSESKNGKIIQKSSAKFNKYLIK